MAATDQTPKDHNPLATQEPSIHGPRPMADAGIIVEIEVVTGEARDFVRIAGRLDALGATLGCRPGTVTADKAYGIGMVYKALSDRDIRAVIPPRPDPRPSTAKDFPTRRLPL